MNKTELFSVRLDKTTGQALMYLAGGDERARGDVIRGLIWEAIGRLSIDQPEPEPAAQECEAIYEPQR